jgi:aromatic-L-amino-acid decarboxylase
LRKKLEECTRRGLVPFYLTATIGTTGTCAVDELAEIVKVKEEYPDLWLHIDAAYAGSALICPEYRELAQADQIQHFDSFNCECLRVVCISYTDHTQLTCTSGCL